MPYTSSLDQPLACPIGTCRLTTSRYLPSMAEAPMYALGAFLLGDGFLDDWTLETGDGAEELTSGVATKRVDCSTQTRVMEKEQYSKAVFEDQVDHCLTKPQTQPIIYNW